MTVGMRRLRRPRNAAMMPRMNAPASERLRAAMKYTRIVLSVGALGWIFAKIPFHEVLSILRTATPWLVVCGVSLNVITRFAAAERTQLINRALHLGISRGQVIATLFVSNFYSLLSPGPWLSGAVTVYRYNHLGASFAGSVSSLLLSRIVEAATFLYWGLLLALADDALRPVLPRFVAPLLVGGAALVFIGALVWSRDVRRRRLAAAAMVAVIPATVQLLLSSVALLCLAQAVGATLSWVSAAWISVLVYVVVLLPVSVAGLGVRDVSLISAFALLGWPASAAVAVSMLLLLDLLVAGAIGGVLQAVTTLSRAKQPRVIDQPVQGAAEEAQTRRAAPRAGVPDIAR